MTEDGRPEKCDTRDVSDAPLRKMDLETILGLVEGTSIGEIEGEISNLEARLDALRKLLHVRRGLSPRAKAKGRKRASNGRPRTQSDEPEVPAEA
jgi:hypothetical protein